MIGGHILDFTVKKVLEAVYYTSEFMMILPGEGSYFYKTDLYQIESGKLEKAVQ